MNGEFIIGFIFEIEDNPLDYKQYLDDLLYDILNNNFSYQFEDENKIENFLITLFIDVRRYGDENIEAQSQAKYLYEIQEPLIKIFLFGLDEVGKTSLIRRIKTGEYNDNYFTPTKIFNIEHIPQTRLGFGALTWWDMPGQRIFRKKWLIGSQDANIMIFMIDVANQLRFEEAKTELWRILDRPELNEVPLLILGNKVDLFNHLNENSEDSLLRLENEISESFDFIKISNHPWKFLFTSVKTNYNIQSAINSIFKMISLSL